MMLKLSIPSVHFKDFGEKDDYDLWIGPNTILWFLISLPNTGVLVVEVRGFVEGDFHISLDG